ncbi:hypothetical protein [endosymbiont GvMRE of Glomus versiforme]|uniref:hypothetical protein n=1 Tax=endosymbiont GvMRE of Glomus versiforme TaxID=2039283 RepID=UPI0011C3A34E|nr:hypothetical protein [endosymbiont GvMRE of Glomus versiforme]
MGKTLTDLITFYNNPSTCSHSTPQPITIKEIPSKAQKRKKYYLQIENISDTLYLFLFSVNIV